MIEQEKIEIAKKAFNKGWNYETLRYSDDLNNEDFSEYLQEEIWEYVIEMKEIGTVEFNKKYTKNSINIDDIKNPSHYNSHPSGIECKEINGDMPFFLGSCVKYIWRAGLKNENPAMKDLLKAKEYLLLEQERLEKCNYKKKFVITLDDTELIEKTQKVIEYTENVNVKTFYMRLLYLHYDVRNLIECIDGIIKDYE